MRKWTWERVQEAVEDNLPQWKLNQNEPEKVRCTMKLKLLCPRSHENNEKRATDIERENGLGCSQCNKENQAQETYSRYVEALENEGWTMVSSFEELLESRRKFAQTPLKVLCPNGEPHLTGWNSFSQGSRCSCSLCRPHKSGIKKGQKHKIKGIFEARERFRELGLELLTDEWLGRTKKIKGKTVHQRYDVRCLVCGYIRQVFPSAIWYKENFCPVCSGHKDSLETFTLWTKENRPEFEIPQDQIYEGCMTGIKIFCSEHNETFELRPNDFKNGVNSCSICVFTKKSVITKRLHEQYNIDGNNHPYWNGLRLIYAYLREQLGDWKKLSMQSHGYKCFINGERIGAIHHSKCFKDIVIETIKQTNLPIHETTDKYTLNELKLIRSTCLKLHDFYGFGFPLSKEIHEEFHSIYGNGGNTLDQFVEFLSAKGHEELARKVKEDDIKRKTMMKKKYPEFSNLA